MRIQLQARGITYGVDSPKKGVGRAGVGANNVAREEMIREDKEKKDEMKEVGSSTNSCTLPSHPP